MPIMRIDGIAAALSWLHVCGARGLCSDSRRLRPGDAFIAWPGHAHDARLQVDAALAAGALACIVEAQGVEQFAFEDKPTIAAMAGLKAACGELAAAFLGQPSDSLQVLAVTGTNGKTSTAWWLAQALTALGRRCGVIGTLGIGCPGSPPELVPTGLTTPDPMALQQALRRFADEGFSACAIEASSIGIAEQRLAGTRIAIALLTNFTQDHLDYHPDMAAYWQAKRRLFDWTGLRAAVVNLDDQQGRLLAGELVDRPIDLWTYSAVDPSARLAASQVGYRDDGLSFELAEGADVVPVRSKLIGEFNVANLLAVIGGLRAIGVPLQDAAQACEALSAVPGRMQRISGAGSAAPEVVVDYAHTPDAIEKALAALQALADSRGGRLWCVFGCGGNRDRGKRPLMAAVAERLAAQVVVTSDNPRLEVPSDIIAEVLAGLRRPGLAIVIEDRREAIAHALQHAEPADVVLIAGKGHEDYQEIGERRLPFSDVEVATQQLMQLRQRSDRGPLQ